ncbi:uncharacterized protein LOC117344973 [Pecten maximus]|uniref:uncharacterized protein LOC117344973 n=1 Tax=Pecten maximus TaxID=6579 RepID=UPI0014590D4D|nr:uncharacterized protein LOC117344973 [Pecten maximus]
MEVDETPYSELKDEDSTSKCAHCQCSVSLAGQKTWPVTSCISGLTQVADILHKKVPECKFTVSDDSFVCNKCYTLVEKIVKKQEVATLMQKESLKAELELKMLMPGLQLEGVSKEQLSTAVLNKDTTKSEDKELGVEWFAMLTDSKSKHLVAHCSNKGASFLEQNQEIFKTFPQFCFPSDPETSTQIDHNYFSKESGDNPSESKTEKQGLTDGNAENIPLVPSKSRRKKAVPAKAASPSKSSTKDVVTPNPTGVKVSRKKRKSKAIDEDSTFEAKSDTDAPGPQSSDTCIKSKLRVALRD